MVTIKCKYTRDGIFKEREKNFTGETWREASALEYAWFNHVAPSTIIDRRILEHHEKP